MCKRKVMWMLSMFLAIMFGFSSCTKKSDEVYDKDDMESGSGEKVPVSETDFIETDKDLLEVDYKEFYDELSPHGEWIKVDANELGIDLENGTKAGESGSILNDLIGVKTAHADDFGFGMFFVWRPNPNLAVSVVAGEAPVYVPYVNGRWVYTDAGWYFMAPTPYEEITVHYGRWVWHPYMGWVWIPGRVWAPSWVEWRVSPTYIAWAPLPPSVYIVNYYVNPIVIHEDRYIVVERRYFCEPHVYKHSFFYKHHKHKFKFHDMSRPDGIMVVDNKVINRGPDVFDIERSAGNKIEQVSINKVSDRKDVKYSDKEYSVYSPKFDRVKNSENRKEPVSKPDKFAPFSSKGNKEPKSDERSGQQDNKNMSGENNDKSVGSKKAGKDNIQKDKSSKKLGDDRGMKNSEKLNEYNQKENYKQKNDYKLRNDNKQKRNDKSNGEYKEKRNQKNYEQDKGKKKPLRNENFRQRDTEKRNEKKSYREKSSNKLYGNYNQPGTEKNKSYNSKSRDRRKNQELDSKKSGSKKESREKGNKNRRK